MASDGLSNTARTGTCRMCLRARKSEHLKIVGEVRHGFATGHIWECKNIVDCETAVMRKLNDDKLDSVKETKIRTAMKIGRYDKYVIIT